MVDSYSVYSATMSKTRYESNPTYSNPDTFYFKCLNTKQHNGNMPIIIAPLHTIISATTNIINRLRHMNQIFDRHSRLAQEIYTSKLFSKHCNTIYEICQESTSRDNYSSFVSKLFRHNSLTAIDEDNRKIRWLYDNNIISKYSKFNNNGILINQAKLDDLFDQLYYRIEFKILKKMIPAKNQVIEKTHFDRHVEREFKKISHYFLDIYNRAFTCLRECESLKYDVDLLPIKTPPNKEEIKIKFSNMFDILQQVKETESKSSKLLQISSVSVSKNESIVSIVSSKKTESDVFNFLCCESSSESESDETDVWYFLNEKDDKMIIVDQK